MLDRLSKRTKAALFVVCFIPADIVATFAALGFGLSAQPTSTDLLLVAVPFAVLVTCEVLAAYMTFYVMVSPRAAVAKAKGFGPTRGRP